MPEITAIVNAHREAEIAHYSLRSAMRSIEYCRERGISAELMVVMDRPDAATQEVVEN